MGIPGNCSNCVMTRWDFGLKLFPVLPDLMTERDTSSAVITHFPDAPAPETGTWEEKDEAQPIGVALW